MLFISGPRVPAPARRWTGRFAQWQPDGHHGSLTRGRLDVQLPGQRGHAVPQRRQPVAGPVRTGRQGRGVESGAVVVDVHGHFGPRKERVTTAVPACACARTLARLACAARSRTVWWAPGSSTGMPSTSRRHRSPAPRAAVSASVFSHSRRSSGHEGAVLEIGGLQGPDEVAGLGQVGGGRVPDNPQPVPGHGGVRRRPGPSRPRAPSARCWTGLGPECHGFRGPAGCARPGCRHCAGSGRVRHGCGAALRPPAAGFPPPGTAPGRPVR